MNFFWGEMGGVLVQTQTQVHSSLRASNARENAAASSNNWPY